MGLIKRLFGDRPRTNGGPAIEDVDSSVHPSKAFSHVMGKLTETPHPRVLDLGPACPDNMTFFGDLNCRLEIFDLFTWLCDYRTRSSRRGDSAIDAALDRLLGTADENAEADSSEADRLQSRGPGSTQSLGSRDEADRDRRSAAPPETAGDESAVDLILAWDLIDYLELDEIARLFDRLEERRGETTRILMIPSYRGPIPHRPRRYRVVDDHRLRCDEPPSDGRPSPGHKERRLLMALPGYEIETSFLMQRGVQEFVFRSAAGETAATTDRDDGPAGG